MSEVTQNDKIDEVLYSRQIYAIGYDALQKLSSSSVLISGIGGLGVEIAKNIILSGVKNVTIHDTRNTEINDLASNYYLTEKSIGKNRATESFTQLSKLNDHVTINIKTENITNDLIKNYDCVVITDFHPESEIKKISSFCHQNKIKLILTETRGLFAYIFTDFGQNFIVKDPTNETPKRFTITSINKSEHSLVTIVENDDHDLCDGDHVTFEEIEGMTEINGKEFEVKVINKRQFTIGDTRSFGDYSPIYYGYGKKVIIPQKFDFLEFTEALKNIKTKQIIIDYDTEGQDQQVLLAFIAAQHSLDKNCNKNTPDISGDELLESAKEVNSFYKIVNEIDENLIREFARESSSVICPVCSIFGGIVGQEIIKSISYKFVPINQFLTMEFTSCLPKDKTCELKNDRYDPYRIIFGNKQQESIENLRYLLVGLGSMGCEYIKNFSMMGVAMKEKSKLYVADYKSIKKSNLSTHFLFRKEDIGKIKGEIAVKSAHEINPNINIEFIQSKLDHNSSFYKNDAFFENIDGVCIAVDNTETRLFLDSECVFYNIPHIVSQTTKLSAYYQAFVPKITESYSSIEECSPLMMDISSVHNFPTTFYGCYLWSSDMYYDLFERNPQLVSSLFNKQINISQMNDDSKQELQNALIAANKFYIDEKCENFNDCIKWAKIQFDEFFNKRIKLLINKFPEDLTNYNGLLFWSGERKLPRPAIFDPKNPDHAQFVKVASILRAKICQIEPQDVDIPQIASSFQISDEKSNGNIYEEKFQTLYERIIPFINKPDQKPPKPEIFLTKENDDDDFSNICFDFIQSTIRIRAFNYHIKTEDKYAIKKYLRKINPSIITTASMISGLASLELYKIHCIDEDKKINDFRIGSINLASSTFFIFEQGISNPKSIKVNGINYSVWDKWIFDGDLTINELMKEVYEKYELTIEMITANNHLIYPLFNDAEKTRKRFISKITDILINEFDQPQPNEQHYYIRLDCLCTDDDENDVETPPICLRIKK